MKKIKKIVRGTGTRIVGGSLPDIDSDFDTDRLGEVKDYMKRRFGRTQVASVATYGTMKLKGAIKDLHRLYSSNFEEVNLVTSIIDSKEDKTVADLFRRAAKEPKLAKFIKKYPDVFFYLPAVLNQPKNKSIHACATMIFPKEKHMKNWCPIFKNKDGIPLTEWEGKELDGAGFLKQDILGVDQLSKFKNIVSKIGDNGKKTPDIYNIECNNPNVFDFYSKGWNCDTFQTGSSDLAKYTMNLKPSNIEDLIACIALYRPGAIENGFHEMYIKRKNGEEDVDYMWGTRDIAKETFGLIVYQEQTINICSSIAGFSQVEADDIRSCMGKKDMGKLLTFEVRFIEGAVNNGCPESEAKKIWDMLIEFSKYSFNKSHSACYGETSYRSQFLKVFYPLEFWSTAIELNKDDKNIPRFLSEIRRSDSVKLVAVDINNSTGATSMNKETNSISWGISSVKGIGDVAAEQIEANKPMGGYEGLHHFIELNKYKGSKVNKKVYEGLIISGAFDSVEKIDMVQKRGNLLNFYWRECNVKVDEKKSWYHKLGSEKDKDWVWLLEQKRLTGMAFFNYRQYCLENMPSFKYMSNDEMLTPLNTEGSVGGVIIEATERNSKKGKWCHIVIESNYEIYNCMIWNDVWKDLDWDIKTIEGRILLIGGNIKYDSVYSNSNQISAKDKKYLKIL